MDHLAKTYVQFTLAVGQHDPNYVDAYYGPPEWKEACPATLADIREKATGTRAELQALDPITLDEMPRLRWHYLAKQLDALITRVDLLSGRKMTFDEESAGLYDVVDVERPDSYYYDVLSQLEPLLPGTGSLGERYDRFRQAFLIPGDKLAQVFSAAIDAARDRTRRHIALPPAEDFHIEYVKGEVWGAYNWYKGNAHSLIQVNTDFPMSIERALHLAAHEGYPGHHVYNALLEQHMVRDRQWLEFTVYPLYSPQSLIAEGTAEYGFELAFPSEERLAIERELLYPLAGLDTSRADDYSQVLAVAGQLRYAGNDAARRYLDGKATREETRDWLVKYTLATPERADQRLRFFEAHGAYIVTYDVGRNLIKRYVEAQATSRPDRWALFTKLLSSPQVPSALTKGP